MNEAAASMYRHGFLLSPAIARDEQSLEANVPRLVQPDGFILEAAMAFLKKPVHECWICGSEVSLEECKIDEHGQAVHEDCYLVALAFTTLRSCDTRFCATTGSGLWKDPNLTGAERASHSLFFIQIFLGNVILRYLMRANFPSEPEPVSQPLVYYISEHCRQQADGADRQGVVTRRRNCAGRCSHFRSLDLRG